MTPQQQVELKDFLSPIFERKAVSVKALNVSELTSYADAVIIVEASSKRQTTAIAEHIVKKMKDTGSKPLGTEGIKEGDWALLDYGDTIIHVFESETRALYDLEGFWADAPQIDLSEYDRDPEQEDNNGN